MFTIENVRWANTTFWVKNIVATTTFCYYALKNVTLSLTSIFEFNLKKIEKL